MSKNKEIEKIKYCNVRNKTCSDVGISTKRIWICEYHLPEFVNNQAEVIESLRVELDHLRHREKELIEIVKEFLTAFVKRHPVAFVGDPSLPDEKLHSAYHKVKQAIEAAEGEKE
jgi:hypothetical protein